MRYTQRRGVTCVIHVSQDCHRDVARLSRSDQCHEMSQRVSNVTEMSRQVTYLSHAVTSCRNSCHTNYAVSQSVSTSVDADKLTYGTRALGVRKYSTYDGDKLMATEGARACVCVAVGVVSIPAPRRLSFLQAPAQIPPTRLHRWSPDVPGKRPCKGLAALASVDSNAGTVLNFGEVMPWVITPALLAEGGYSYVYSVKEVVGRAARLLQVLAQDAETRAIEGRDALPPAVWWPPRLCPLLWSR